MLLQWLFQAFLNIEKPSEKDYQFFFKKIDSVPAGSKGLDCFCLICMAKERLFGMGDRVVFFLE